MTPTTFLFRPLARRSALLAIMAAACLLAGCGKPPARAPDKAMDTAFLRDEASWRAGRLADLVRPDGWTSLVGLHWLEPGPHYVGSNAGNGIRLDKGPAQFGMIDLKGERVFLTPGKDSKLSVDGAPVQKRVELLDDSSATPTKVLFDDGQGQLVVIHRGERRALRVRHAEAAARVGFTGLQYWDADKTWRITGRFMPHEAGKTLPIVDITGMETPQPNPGAIEFTRDGKSYRLEAIGEAGGELFIVMADRTSGQGSYAAGRFVDVDAPDAQGNVTIDFNRAYNPPCAFTPFATCPLPPPENRLDLRVEAGERAYKHTAG